MHVIFIPYGKRSEVDLMLRDMEAQKHRLILTKGKKRKEIWIQGQVRLLPLGLYEYIFPRGDADMVLNTLDFTNNRYNLSGLKLSILRKMGSAKKTPSYDKSHHYLWIKDNVNIIPLGVRYDKDKCDGAGEHEGWTHEAL